MKGFLCDVPPEANTRLRGCFLVATRWKVWNLSRFLQEGHRAAEDCHGCASDNQGWKALKHESEHTLTLYLVPAT